MSAFKNLLKSDTPSSDSGRSGAFGGQGSHFRKDDDQGINPTTVAGTSPQTTATSDITNARGTAGPEAGGSGHVSTASAISTGHSGMDSARDGSSSAAIGQTTTYSSTPLASGDPTGSVIDHGSRDPLTYKKPESGVPSGSAAAAASQAWHSHGSERMPGEFPSSGNENPYRPAHGLDPRVDGGKAGSTSHGTTSHGVGTGANTGATSAGLGSGRSGLGSSNTRDETLRPYESTGYGTGAATGAGSGAGAAGLGSSYPHESSRTTHESTGPAPSSLTATADPASRSADYTRSTDTKGLDAAPSTSATSGTSTTGTHPEDGQQQQGMASRVLGALGLGGAGASAASALGYGNKQNEPHDTSAIATQPGQVSPESGPPQHYRRESIPTTAYPGGPSSPRAVAPPVGGAVAPGERQVSDTPKLSSSTAPAPTEQRGFDSSASTAQSGYDSSAPMGQTSYTITNQTGQDSYTAPAPTGQTFYDQITSPVQPESHTGRNVGLGAAGAAAAGTGAYALHEHNKHEPLSTRGPSGDGTIPTSGTSGTGTGTLPSTSYPTGTAATGGTTAAATGYPSTSIGHPSGGYESNPTASTGYPSDTYGSAPSATTGYPSGYPSSAAGPASSATTGTSTLPDRSRDPLSAVAAAPGRYEGQDARATHPSGLTGHHERREDEHTGRNTALGAGTGAALAGGAAYGAHEHDRSRDIPTSAVGATPGRYEGQDARATHPNFGTGNTTLGEIGSTSRKTDDDSFGTGYGQDTRNTGYGRDTTGLTGQHERRQDDHTGRNPALGAGAGAAVAGGAAYAAHDHEREEAAKRAAEQEKELNKQREAQAKAERHHQKELENQHHKDQKAAEKAEKEHEKEIEKAEKHRQHELEKQEKHRQHELEKEEKERQKALATTQEHERARILDEEENRKRHEREAAAGVGAAAFTGTGMAAHEKYSKHPEGQHPEGQHLQEDTHQKEKKPSIFKRIFKRRKNQHTGEDEDYSTDDEEDKAAKGGIVPTHHSDTKGRNVLGSEGRTSVDKTTGLPYDSSKDPDSARRLEDPFYSTGHGRGTDNAPLGTGAAAGGATGALAAEEHGGPRDTTIGTHDNQGTYGSSTGTHDNHGTHGSSTGTHDNKGTFGSNISQPWHDELLKTQPNHPLAKDTHLGEIGDHRR